MMGPIGVFDSGYGGLTILQELRKSLPEYDFLYLGDNARAPYGSRSFEVIYEYTLQAVKHLFSQNCPLVILACNTASARALRTIQQNDLPHLAPNRRVLGIIRPIAEFLSNQETEIGILATEGTVRSLSYPIEIQKQNPKIKVHQQACPLWTPLVESADFMNQGAEFFVRKDLQTILQSHPQIQRIVLACTHYPLLRKHILNHTPKSIQVIEQGPIVASSLLKYLERHPEIDQRLSKMQKCHFSTTESAEIFAEKAEFFLGHPLNVEHVKLKF